MTVVREFHEAFDLDRPEGPTIPSQDLVRLRMRLIREEYEEVSTDFKKLLQKDLTYAEAIPIMRDLLKELADLRYVTEGAAVALGLDIEAAYKEVHRSNMSKLGEDGKPIYRADRKVLKGPNYTEADLSQIVPDPIEGSGNEDSPDE